MQVTRTESESEWFRSVCFSGGQAIPDGATRALCGVDRQVVRVGASLVIIISFGAVSNARVFGLREKGEARWNVDVWRRLLYLEEVFPAQGHGMGKMRHDGRIT